MGILKEKYTNEYFTGHDEMGNKLNYGATSYRDGMGNYIIRPHDEKILKKIDFLGKKVLEFGFGRGEAARYAIENEAIHYEGVDFSEAALKIALEVTKDCVPKPIFHNRDALESLTELAKNLADQPEKKFDIIIMLDFLEHIPREELYELFSKLHSVIKPKALIAINTPAYKYDNDIINYGLDNRNNENTYDASDFIEATAGMHCNKYSIVSLQKFMQECGFSNITEAHFYIKRNEELITCLIQSYSSQWSKCLREGYPVLGEYIDDEIEFSYQRDLQPVWTRLDSGTMKGIELLCTEDYKNYTYNNGEYDSEMLMDFRENYSNVETVFDVGGFVGVTSLMFAKYLNGSGKVVTFEPNLSNSNRFLLNLSHNTEISQNIYLMKLALGEREQTEQMLMSDVIDLGYSSTSRIANSHAKIGDEMLPQGFFNEEVLVRTLDNVVIETGLIPNVIKVDIEGAEHLFLLGSRETIKRYKPVFYIELHSEFCASMCTMILLEMGYLLEVLHEEEDNRLMIKAYPSEKAENMNPKDQVLSNLITSVNLQRTASRLLDRCNRSLEQWTQFSREKDELLNHKTELLKKNEDLIKQQEVLLKRNDELLDKNNELSIKNKELYEQNSILSDEMRRIYHSRGWKMLQIGYKVKTKLLPK